MKLTKSQIDKLEYKGKDAFYWDEELKGFGLKITRTGKTYIVQARVDNKTIRKKIASVGQLTPDEARKEAKKLLPSLPKAFLLLS